MGLDFFAGAGNCGEDFAPLGEGAVWDAARDP